MSMIWTDPRMVQIEKNSKDLLQLRTQELEVLSDKLKPLEVNEAVMLFLPRNTTQTVECADQA